MSRTLTNPLSSFKPQLISYGLPAFRANQPIAKNLPGVRYKCYAVARGRAPGIYLTPEAAITQTKNYPNSCMRKFSDRLQADRWLLAHSAHQQQLDWATQSWYGKIVTGMEKGKNGEQIELQLIPRVEWKKVKCEMITKEGEH